MFGAPELTANPVCGMYSRVMGDSSQNAINTVASEILFRRYWSAKGWHKGEISAAEFAYAKKTGMMFDPIDASHDGIVENALAIRDSITPETVANAFLFSLPSRRLDLRSALGSYSALLHLTPHRYKQISGRIDCAICGAYLKSPGTDINILNFERHKWGGVRHADPLYASLDLEWFRSAHVPSSGTEGSEILRHAFAKIRDLGPGARPGDAEVAIQGLFASSKAERRIVIDILGLAGVLAPTNLPNFFSSYPECVYRKQPTNKNDWKYPVLWWRGSDGIGEEAMRFWFPNI